MSKLIGMNIWSCKSIDTPYIISHFMPHGMEVRIGDHQKLNHIIGTMLFRAEDSTQDCSISINFPFMQDGK